MPREEDNRVGDKLINEVGSRAANYSPTRACRANLKRASQILSPPIQGGGRGKVFDRIVAAMLQFTLLDLPRPRSLVDFCQVYRMHDVY